MAENPDDLVLDVLREDAGHDPNKVAAFEAYVAALAERDEARDEGVPADRMARFEAQVSSTRAALEARLSHDVN